MDIDSQSAGTDNLAFYAPAFRIVLEDHMTFLRNDIATEKYQVTPGEAYRFEADFYGLLRSRSIATYMHHVVLRMNNMTNPNQMTTDLAFFLVPSPQTLSRLLTTFQANSVQ